jgi:hypothetical protein
MNGHKHYFAMVLLSLGLMANVAGAGIPLLTIGPANTNLMVGWLGRHVLETSPGLSAQAAWSAIATGVAGSTNSFKVALGIGEAYFRLRLIPPPSATSLGNQTNCGALPSSPLSVSVEAGDTADWYALPVGGTSLAMNTLSFVPAGSLPGTFTYYAEARDPLTGLVSASRTAMVLSIGSHPTATLITTNAANNLFVQNNCDYGVSYQVTNILTGTGPWTVQWNDGTNQTIGIPGQAGPVMLSRTVLYPTNFFGANGPHTNVYFVTNVTDSGGCQANAGLGDIVGQVALVMNPRPTVTLITTNGANHSFVQVNCDVAVPYQVTNLLTGMGPWTVQWNDGTNQIIGIAGQAGPVLLSRTLLVPMSQSGANGPQTNVFFVTSVSDLGGCQANPAFGDIVGQVALMINPRPTAVVSGSATICSGSSTNIQAALTGSAPWNVAWSDGVIQTVIASPVIRVVAPLVNTTYTVTNLLDATCVAATTDLKGSATITVVKCN